jgi:hypothetical protein
VELLFLALACIFFVAWLALLLLSDTSDAMTEETDDPNP